MKRSLLLSVASAVLLFCVISVHSVPANGTGGQSAADAEREAWKKIKEQTADFIAHEREYVMSLRKPVEGTIVPGQAVVAETVAAAANVTNVAAAPAQVAAAPDSAATTLPPAVTVAPTNFSSTSVGSAADLPQTTISAPSAA